MRMDPRQAGQAVVDQTVVRRVRQVLGEAHTKVATVLPEPLGLLLSSLWQVVAVVVPVARAPVAAFFKAVAVASA